MITYRYASEVEAVARPLIQKYHRHLLTLAPSEMRFVMRSEAAKNKGKLVLGKARKVAGFNAFLADECAPTIAEEAGEPEPIFVIEIAGDQWDNMSDAQREALVDHELCHCGIELSKEGTPQKVIYPHDLEAFTAEVERHGLWKSDVKDFVMRSVRANPTLFDDPGGDPVAAATYSDEDLDQAYVNEAIDLVVRSQLGSTSMLQRKQKVSFTRANRIMAILEERGIVGPVVGPSQPRAVLMTVEELDVLQADQGRHSDAPEDPDEKSNVIPMNRLNPSEVLKHGAGILDSDGLHVNEAQAAAQGLTVGPPTKPDITIPQGYVDQMAAQGVTVSVNGTELVPTDPHADPAAEHDVLVPHELSPLQGEPCTADADNLYDHRDCEEQADDDPE